MKKIYICARKKDVYGNTKKYKQYARIYCRIAWDKGLFPIAPNLYLPQFLDDTKTAEISDVRKLCCKALEVCAEVWVFGTTITKDMQAEIERAKELKIPVKYHDVHGDPL